MGVVSGAPWPPLHGCRLCQWRRRRLRHQRLVAAPQPPCCWSCHSLPHKGTTSVIAVSFTGVSWAILATAEPACSSLGPAGPAGPSISLDYTCQTLVRIGWPPSVCYDTIGKHECIPNYSPSWPCRHAAMARIGQGHLVSGF